MEKQWTWQGGNQTLQWLSAMVIVFLGYDFWRQSGQHLLNGTMTTPEYLMIVVLLACLGLGLYGSWMSLTKRDIHFFRIHGEQLAWGMVKYPERQHTAIREDFASVDFSGDGKTLKMTLKDGTVREVFLRNMKAMDRADLTAALTQFFANEETAGA